MLIGTNGQVGWELQRSLLSVGNVIPVDRAILNLADLSNICRVVRDIMPDIIVNAAAYTNVDQAELEPEVAMMINGIAPGVLAEEAKRIGSSLVHYSTDFVFDGMANTPYTELSQPNPISIYGRTKLAGEQAVVGVGGAYVILRTSWVYGWRGRNFLISIVRGILQRRELSVVNDQFGSPTWSRMIAEFTARILCGRNSVILPRDQPGLYHLAGNGVTSRFEFASAIIGYLQDNLGAKSMKLNATDTMSYGSNVPRPSYSVLDCEKLSKCIDVAIPSWDSVLELCFADLRELLLIVGTRRQLFDVELS